MKFISYQSYKSKVKEKRFFEYDSFHDKLFVPPARLLAYLSVNFGISANQVSLFSATIAVAGSILLASQNNFVILIGSFGLMIWYLLDYVDGMIARYHNTSSIEGQYVDWLAHSIACNSTMIGIAIGALNIYGICILPFCILSILSMVLFFEKQPYGWFSITMYEQQRKLKNTVDICDHNITPSIKFLESNLFSLCFKRFNQLLFHENYLIFILPVAATSQYFFINTNLDLRGIYVFLGGSSFLIFNILHIRFIIRHKKLTSSYKNLFNANKKPSLPDDHFF